ncbi:MAG: F510_1955 family glycosylhydrolase [Bacillota bacterium]
MNRKQWIYQIFICVILLVTSACSNNKVTIEHIHGLGYTSDGKQILIPAHDGLVSYSDGKWGNVDSPKNDYMGFQTVDNGFYSSGHPGPGSTLKDPIGIVKSSDLGKTLTKLGFEGESDFHRMAVGYKTHAIYVINEQQSSKLNSSGLFYSTDDAKNWTKSAAAGLNEEPTALAVHPTDEKTIAIGTKSGLLISNDFGNRFEMLLPDQFITSLNFGENGELLIAGAINPNLIDINITTKKKKEMKLPVLDNDDAVSYMDQNPKDANEIVVTTFKKDVYLSKDLGLNWTKIVDKGNGISSK